jgi:hypothetical protein
VSKVPVRPFLGEVVGHGFAAALQIAHSRQERHRVRVLPEDDGVHHAAQVRVGEVLVALLDHDGVRELCRGDQQADDRLP